VQGYSAVVAIAGALLLGLAVGFVNGLVVEHFKIDSFIGTLGISSVLAAVAYMIVSGSQFSASRTIDGSSTSPGRIGSASRLRCTTPRCSPWYARGNTAPRDRSHRTPVGRGARLCH
jgi:ABC-type xylose transport system permease subunit